MAESLANLSKSDGKWKYHNQATGSVAITLPATFNELFVKTEYTVSGSYTRIYCHYLIYEALPNTMSTNNYYNIGFGQTLNNVSQNNWSSIWCGRDKVQLNRFSEANSDVTSSAITTVYYR